MKDASFFYSPQRVIDVSCSTPLPRAAPPCGQCWKDQNDLKRSPRPETRSGGRAWLGPVPKRQLVQRSPRRFVFQVLFCSRRVILYFFSSEISSGFSFFVETWFLFFTCFKHVCNRLLKHFLMAALKSLLRCWLLLMVFSDSSCDFPGSWSNSDFSVTPVCFGYYEALVW